MLFKKSIVILTLLSCFVPALLGQLPAGGFKFSGNAKSTSIPFVLSDNLIVIKVELNGLDLKLILDTGMPIEGALLFGNSRIDSANLNFTQKIPVGGIGGDPVLSDLALGATLKVPDLQLTNQMIIHMPHNKAQIDHFEGKDGIIGFSFFSKFVVGIDYEKQILTISDPAAFSYAGNGKSVPCEVVNNRIFVRASILQHGASTIDSKLVVDTGNRAALIVNTKKTPGFLLPKDAVSYFGHGLTAQIDMKIGTIKGFEIEGFRLNELLVSMNESDATNLVPWEREGNLGNEILRRFNVVFDLPNNQIYFEKNKFFDDKFQVKLLGIQYERLQDKALNVFWVIPNTPAHRAGIAAGDKLISIDDKLVSSCTSDEIAQLLNSKNNDVMVKIIRDGKQMDKVIKK